jgi:hypothetical protein
MVPIPEGVERHEGEPPDDGPGTPKDAEGGVGGASVNVIWNGGEKSLGRDGDGRGFYACGSPSKGKGKEIERERTGDVERDIMMLTKRLEEKQEARRKASEADLRG